MRTTTDPLREKPNRTGWMFSRMELKNFSFTLLEVLTASVCPERNLSNASHIIKWPLKIPE